MRVKKKNTIFFFFFLGGGVEGRGLFLMFQTRKTIILNRLGNKKNRTREKNVIFPLPSLLRFFYLNFSIPTRLLSEYRYVFKNKDVIWSGFFNTIRLKQVLCFFYHMVTSVIVKWSVFFVDRLHLIDTNQNECFFFFKKTAKYAARMETVLLLLFFVSLKKKNRKVKSFLIFFSEVFS